MNIYSNFLNFCESWNKKKHGTIVCHVSKDMSVSSNEIVNGTETMKHEFKKEKKKKCVPH